MTRPHCPADGLPAKAAGSPITTCVDIADIITRADWQVRVRIDDATVRSYASIMRAGGDMPPVSIARIDGALYLVDGWHRLEATKLNGETFIEATVCDMSEEAARWAAARANLTHGLPLKPREIRSVFRAYVGSSHHRDGVRFKSYRDIAADLAHHVQHTTVRNWMRQDFPAVFAAMGGGEPAEEAGGARDIPTISPLSRAKASLDQAVAEARRLSAEDRRALLEHLREAEKRLAEAAPWEPMDDAGPDF
ncbi:ParB/RepB/Spo0J family partition protein [Xanthobacter autotrophicus]|uniref:ParB/RepB/Spo0J family partition protein n=1 Tax=Xanthobacter autotrophicus TaxID=280 RepID=UPI00372C302D